MTSMNISIKKEAYDFLKSIKTEDKSFSDIILDFKKEGNGLLKYHGALKDKDWTKAEGKMKDLRKSFSKRLK